MGAPGSTSAATTVAAAAADRSAVVRRGVALAWFTIAWNCANAALGWWRADPLDGLGIVYVAGREGIEHWRADDLGGCCT